jgi:hypothetical protein
MKISPMASPANIAPSAPDAAPAMAARTLRMNTNATPGRADGQVEELPPAAPVAPKLTNPDPNDPATATDEATQPLSPQFVALAKQRRALQQERQEFERQKAEAAKAPVQGAGIDVARLKSDPLGVLLENDVTYDQLTQAILANQNGSSPELQALKAKIAELETGVEKRFTDRDAQAEQQVLAEMKKDATTLAAEGEDFEMIRETGSIPDVMSLIERTYRESGEVLDVREAMTLIEDELVTESLKIAGIKKVQGRLAPPAPQPQQQQRSPMRTLTNRDTATVPMSRKARALAAFRGEPIK